MRVDTLIVGGGVMGAAIALERARATDPITHPVLLLERRAPGAGSSGRSGAILRQFYSDSELISMAGESLSTYASFELRTGRPIGFTRCGVLTIAGPGNPQTLPLVERNLERMRACGAEVVALDRDAGATVRCGVEVLELVVENGRVRRALTSDGEIECERVVVAAGPWSRNLLARSGLSLPLRVVRPEQHFVVMPRVPNQAAPVAACAPEVDFDRRFAGFDVPAPAHPVLLDLEKGFYTRCEPSRERTRVGAMDYDRDHELADPDMLEESVSAEFSRWSREILVSRLPFYAREQDCDVLAAWYTLTPDAQPLLGVCPGLDNVLLATGFSGHGFKLAPSVGQGIAQMLAGIDVRAFDARFFDPARFARNSGARSGAFGL
ncbi:MAG: FAD-dependent oxidoreductase [Planctomycetota bacterium]|nr:FAD-dependent oxidoreductase [Planctomycetota bacterium]